MAVAIADHFRRLGCIAVISTHHTSLKVYGANTGGVVNASVGFNEATLQPTYELKIGVPGASAGINIAQRLGLNPTIIDAARARLGSQARTSASSSIACTPICARRKLNGCVCEPAKKNFNERKLIWLRKVRKNSRPK